MDAWGTGYLSSWSGKKEQKRDRDGRLRMEDEPEMYRAQRDTVHHYKNVIVNLLFDHHILSSYSGLPIDVETVDALSKTLARSLNTSIGSVRDSLIPDVGKYDLDREKIEEISWRLAGNLNRLRQGIPVTEWKGQVAHEWCLVRITGAANSGLSEKGNPTFAFGYFVESGSPAGHKFRVILARRRMYGMFRSLGLSRDYIEHCVPEALTNTRSYFLLKQRDQDDEDLGEPYIERINTAQAMKKHNRSLFRRRMGKECPYGLKPVTYLNCFRCPRGYENSRFGDDYCEHAVRRKALPAEEEKKDDSSSTDEAGPGGGE